MFNSNDLLVSEILIFTLILISKFPNAFDFEVRHSELFYRRFRAGIGLVILSMDFQTHIQSP